MKLYTSKVIASWLDLSERRIRQLRDEGVLAETKPGLYELRPTVARYISYLRKGGNDLNDERAKLTRAKREAVEMENDLRKGRLHETADIEKGLQSVLLNIRSRFLSMPAKLSPSLAAQNLSQTEIFDVLKSAVDEALEELSGCCADVLGGDASKLEGVPQVELED